MHAHVVLRLECLHEAAEVVHLALMQVCLCGVQDQGGCRECSGGSEWKGD
jgi:hypothetical protein